MRAPEKNLQEESLGRLNEAVRSYGLHKQLALDLRMSDTELSRLLREQAPKLINLLSILGLEVVDAEHVNSLKRVLKEVL
jgi:hypothetical protein